MKKVLIIPHHPGSEHLKIRLIEVAKVMSVNYDVYVADWQVAKNKGAFVERISLNFMSVFGKIRLSKQSQLSIVKFPVVRRPLGFSLWLNSASLKKFIEEKRIDVVINGSSHLFGIFGERSYKYICDIADVPVLGLKRHYDRFVQRQLEIELKEADFVTVCSQGLVKYIDKYYGKSAVFIPNGADVAVLRLSERLETDRIRQMYGIANNSRVIGYIGNIGRWVDVELVVNAFKELQNELKNIVLLFVGITTDGYEKKYKGKNIIFTGGVDPQKFNRCFSLIDVGIIPHKPSLFQDLAFHIKAIEYTAGRKPIISTPLKEMRLLNFPNVIFAGTEKQEWVKAMKEAINMPWQEQWDSLVEGYDWKDISGMFAKLF